MKVVYYLELLVPESMELFGSTKSKITKNKIGENVPHLKITELGLVHCRFVNNDYQQYSKVLNALVSNISFGHLLDISPKNFRFLRTFDSEFSYK